MAEDRLGCASTYDAEIRFRGGGSLWTPIQGMTELKWSRKRDDFSEASLVVTKSKSGADCCGRLGRTRTWGHELRIYRDQKPVWEGPIIRKTERRGTVELEARDMLFWLDRREIAGNVHEWAGKDTGQLIRELIQASFLAGNVILDPGLIEYADLRNSGTTSTTDRLWAATTTIGEVVRDLIPAGVDLFAVGRKIHSFHERTQLAYTPHRFTETHFLDELQIMENGLDACTRALVVGGQPVDGAGQPIEDVAPVIGSATVADADALAFYGLVTRMTTSNNVVQQGVANGIASAMLAAGFPPPIDIQVPTGARLSPEAPVDINQLIPGRPFTVLLDTFCERIQQPFRLNEMEVTWDTDEVEQIAVSLAAIGPAQGVPQEVGLP